MKKSVLIKVFVAVSTLALVAGSAASANAAAKTITCYKGTVAKKFTATKCPTGYTAKPTKTTAPATAAKALAFDGSYSIKATFSYDWISDSALSVNVKTITATGTKGNVNGLTQLSGTANTVATAQCGYYKAEGTLSDGTNSLTLTFDAKSEGCAKDDSTPTSVTVNPTTAVVKSGTGKFAGATGSLKISGSFPMVSSSKDKTSEVVPGTLNISGSITTK